MVVACIIYTIRCFLKAAQDLGCSGLAMDTSSQTAESFGMQNWLEAKKYNSSRQLTLFQTRMAMVCISGDGLHQRFSVFALLKG
jgi:hypothetical protein